VTCGTCFWWTHQECHKAAPVALQASGGSIVRVWPETRERDFCGDYKAQPAMSRDALITYRPSDNQC
jgi:hypothetical protein